jgi:hypothetical protein
MVELVIKTSFTHRGLLRDKIRQLVAAELDAIVEDEPPAVFLSKSGETRLIKADSVTIIRKHVAHIFRGYLFLDSQRTLCVSDSSSRSYHH